MSRHEIHVEESIQASPAAVFHILSDAKRIRDWLPHVTAVQSAGTKTGVGAERVVALRLHGHEVSSEQRIIEYEPGKRFAWVHVRDTVDGKPFDLLTDVGSDFTLSAEGKATRVAARAHFLPHGIKARLAVPLISHEIKKQMHDALSHLKALAEKK